MHLSHSGKCFKVCIPVETELQRSWTAQCIVPTENSSHSSLFQNYTVTEYCLFSRLFSTCLADWRDHHRRSSDHFLHATLSLHHHYTSLTTGGEFRKGKHASPVKTKSHDKISSCERVSSVVVMNIIWLTDSCAHLLHATPCHKRYVLPNNKMLD